MGINSKTVSVIKRSPWVKGRGMLPSRIILWHRKSDDSYVTHVEVKQENGALSFVWGHYDMSKAKAMKDFTRRVRTL